MLFNTLVAATTLLSSVSALPQPQQPSGNGPVETGYNWTVTNWIATCGVQNDCTWSFEVAGDDFGADAERPPAFSANCTGTHAGLSRDSYETCTPTHASLDFATTGVATRTIKHRILAVPQPHIETGAPKKLALQVSYEFVYSFEGKGPGKIHNITSSPDGTLAPVTEDPTQFIIENLDPAGQPVLDTVESPKRPIIIAK
ncbi:hypothetical protein HYFRA_00012831 [Hymenoscyphus fraxineus]|uniref:Uncharacterized protein n=1 Tax=Hymenoscyphus fraxineus TaxID=746836 RepID=A0A9N9L340_9HELO|nr:hypothetical protein HYFRA_00012831 [Hymenoscyphus fraxineus]